MHNYATAANLELSMNDEVTEQQDEILMMRYSTGDTAAFEVLYARHKGPLFRYFKRLCFEAAIVEELFQECWMSIIKARKNYKSSAKFTTYMYTIAHNKLIDYYRRTKTRFPDISAIDNSEIDTSIETIAARTQEQPEQVIAYEQKRNQLLNAIKLLPEKQREVFLLREESGLSLDEIARITRVNVETAKSRLRYAVKSLTQKIRAGDS